MTRRLTSLEGRTRREQWLTLRRQGLSKHEASARLGGLSHSVTCRYENWFQAEQRGERAVPGSRWPAKGQP